jgi:hypothetical protein
MQHEAKAQLPRRKRVRCGLAWGNGQLDSEFSDFLRNFKLASSAFLVKETQFKRCSRAVKGAYIWLLIIKSEFKRKPADRD